MAGPGTGPGRGPNAGSHQIALPPGATTGGHRFKTGPGAYELPPNEPRPVPYPGATGRNVFGPGRMGRVGRVLVRRPARILPIIPVLADSGRVRPILSPVAPT